MKLNISKAVGMFIIVLLFSCKKFVEIDPPSQRLESDKIFSNDQTALSALNGLYFMLGVANLSLLNGGVTLYTGLSSDEIYNTSPSTDSDPFFNNTLTSDHSNLYNRLWRAAYNNNNLYTANAIIEKLSASNALTITLKNQLHGEAKVIRCLGYFYLVNLFGDVPLVISTDLEQNSVMSRTPTNEIYNFLIQDLTEAKSLLAFDYPLSNKTRISKTVAAALLARIYLYTEEWGKAESNATEIINSGLFQLEKDLNTVFNSINSRETIWQLSKDGLNTSDGATYIPSTTSGKPTYAITTHLYNSFEIGDERKINWIETNIVGGMEYQYPFKYKSRLPMHPVEYNIIFRLAEQYLIRAEARAKLGNITGALEDLNTIRQRAGLPDFQTDNIDTLLYAILNERRHEFFSEMGHRWLDLKRTDNANVNLAALKFPNWESTDVLYPIPQIEIDRNPFLIQNAGY